MEELICLMILSGIGALLGYGCGGTLQSASLGAGIAAVLVIMSFGASKKDERDQTGEDK